MNFPEKINILVITLSDRASRGEYDDLSGPMIVEMVSAYFSSVNMSINIASEIIPDDSDKLKDLLLKVTDSCNIIFTTGGTGIGPRDITIDTVKPLLKKEIPGIMEYIRVRYGSEHPNALLSRGVSGIIGISLIYTLPGSVKAVEEYMNEILKTLLHTIYMQYGIDKHNKH